MEIRRALTLHGPLRRGSSQRASEGFILVAPQLPTEESRWHAHLDDLIGIVEAVHKRFNGDPTRTYLTGFSYGADGVFQTAHANPSFWAALWPVDPTFVPHHSPKRPLWLSLGELSRDHKDEFIERLDLVSGTREGPGERVYEDRGRDHVGTATAAYQDDKVYAWLLDRQL